MLLVTPWLDLMQLCLSAVLWDIEQVVFPRDFVRSFLNSEEVGFCLRC